MDLRTSTSVPRTWHCQREPPAALETLGTHRKPIGSWKPTQQSIQTSILQKRGPPSPLQNQSWEKMEARPGVALLDTNRWCGLTRTRRCPGLRPVAKQQFLKERPAAWEEKANATWYLFLGYPEAPDAAWLGPQSGP